MLRLLAITASLAVAAEASAVQLTKANFDAEIIDSGKSGFVKFLAPWGGHCKKMKPDWDKLGTEYKDSSSVVIGDADCTAGAKDLCSDMGVRGYPTIKYFMAGEGKEGKDYQGGRDYGSLKKFIDDDLSKGCEVDNAESCDEKENAYIAKMKGKGAEKITTELARLSGMKNKAMKADRKKWMLARIHLLTQLDAKTDL
jgi:protein disulfide-isomerase A6